MEKTYKNCQSCGMPLSKDPNGGGTNADGTKSGMYCSYCYQNGAFVGSCNTAQEMQEFCKNKLKEMGYGSFMSWLLTMQIPKLERWKNK